METKIFDKDTMLDLMVNFIPLGILLFFIVGFVVVAPWGFELRTSGVMLTIMVTMFVALVVLTYISAKAIAGDEKQHPVYAQGQAGLEGAKTIHEQEEAIAAEEAGEPVSDDGDGEEDVADEDASDDSDKDANDEEDAETGDDESEDEGADDETDEDAANKDAGEKEEQEATADDADDTDTGDEDAVNTDGADDEETPAEDSETAGKTDDDSKQS